MSPSPRILVVRLGAMGDIVHALPAVATLKHNFPQSQLSWVVESRWTPLLQGNPFVDQVIPVDRRSVSGLVEAVRRLRNGRFDFVIDFQGLIKSALAASLARADRIFGFDPSQLRERLAGLFYSSVTWARAAHVVDRNLELAARAGASRVLRTFPIPPGADEGGLPDGPFLLACPLAGWRAKQWPLESYHRLGRLSERELGLPLVLNGPPGEHYQLGPHYIPSGIPGLIHALRRAAAVVGVDSGPIHLAAALARPGVAIYGPTDPARNGPYGGTITVLRSRSAPATYKRGGEIDESMRRIAPEQVLEALNAAGCHA